MARAAGWPCDEIGFVSHKQGWGSRREAGGAANWVRFAFFGFWLLGVGLVELGSFRIFGDGRPGWRLVGRGAREIGFVSHFWFVGWAVVRQIGFISCFWRGAGSVGANWVRFAFLAVGFWQLAVGLGGLGSFRIIGAWAACGGCPYGWIVNKMLWFLKGSSISSPPGWVLVPAPVLKGIIPESLMDVQY